MRISDLLNESPRDELLIQRIAEACVVMIQSKLDQQFKADGGTPPTLAFKLGELPRKTLGALYNRLSKTEIFMRSRSVGELGGNYNTSLNSIVVDVSVNMATGVPVIGDRGRVVSVLVHELRHRLDASLSKRKSFKWDKPYDEQDHEINARFSELQAELVTALKTSIRSGSLMTLRQFVEKFEQLAVKFNLMQVFAKDDKAVDTFVHFMQNGVFGRPVPPEMVKAMALSANDLAANADIGPLSDPRYRRLLKRVTTLYYYVVERDAK